MKIELAPRNIEVELPNYGTFNVIPLGAGAEAEIKVVHRKIAELNEEVKKYNGIVEKEKNGEDVDKESEEYKNALKAYNDLLDAFSELKDITLEKMRGCFKGKNAEKIFNDFSYEQIMQIYSEAVNSNE